ncbi:MAG: hypothetical protein CTY15_06660 [Methylocystis sp.]|nr:MAG: hypothetical protein CTY15_06660 [Methylocystis sp.]
MSDEPVSQPEDAVSPADLQALQEQLKAAKAERDRQIFEKTEIVSKANAYAKERDELKEQLASVLSERDKIIGDVVADHDKIVADITSERDRLAQEKASLSALFQDATRRAEDAGRRADEAAAEIARLRSAVAAAPSSDPVEAILKLASEKTKAGVAWARGKIPADSPVLPYFDKTLATATTVGCKAVRLFEDLVLWLTPRVIELSKQGMAKVEEMLAKK